MEFSISSFFEAFSEAIRPSINELTPHRCLECNKVRGDFVRYSVNDIPDDVMKYHGDSIPFLSPVAFRYYLPAYIKYSCNNHSSNAAECVLYALCPYDIKDEFWNGRCDVFTKKEIMAIIKYLEFRRTLPEAEFEEDWISIGINFWGSLLDDS